MTFDEAKNAFTGKYFRYSHFYEGEIFYQKEIAVADLPSHRLRKTTTYYVKLLRAGNPCPPIWVLCGYKLRNGSLQPFHYGTVIMDGNHRLGAHRELGLKTIPVILSESQFALFEYLRGQK